MRVSPAMSYLSITLLPWWFSVTIMKFGHARVIISHCLVSVLSYSCLRLTFVFPIRSAGYRWTLSANDSRRQIQVRLKEFNMHNQEYDHRVYFYDGECKHLVIRIETIFTTIGPYRRFAAVVPKFIIANDMMTSSNENNFHVTCPL